ncbi:MAG: hypothetical protein ABR988_16180 [Terriglobales bacterium]|jgi:hypothetical protein
MQHRATTDFWRQYHALSQEVHARADKQFSLLKANSQHPSLQFKRVGERHGREIWSARITVSVVTGLRPVWAGQSPATTRTIKRADGYLWFWIGDHKGL